jgi:hypothetical protein
MRTSVLLLAASCLFAASAQAQVWFDGPGFLLDTVVNCIPAPDDQGTPAVAFDGTNFLVVWVDDPDIRSDILCSRVGLDGTVLDRSGIVVSAAPGTKEAPAVAFDGTDFFVVWQHSVNGPYICGARVTTGGVVLDSAGVRVAQSPGYQYRPAVAFGAGSLLVTWADSPGGSTDIYAARVSVSGVALDTVAFLVSGAPDDQWSPKAAATSRNWLVVWEDRRSHSSADVYGARVSPAGVVLDPDGIAVSRAADDQESPVVTSSGAGFLVTWQDWRSGSEMDVYGARVDTTGAVLDTSGIAVSLAPEDQSEPSAVFDGGNYLVCWADERDLKSDAYAARLTQAGVVLDPQGIVLSRATGDKQSVSVAGGGQASFVAWQDSRDFVGNIYGARISPAGAVLDTSGLAVSLAANDQWYPSVASDSHGFLIAWQDARGAGPDVYAVRVRQDGARLDSTAVPVCTAPGDQTWPVVARGCSTFLAAWVDERNDESDIYATRMNDEGVVLDTEGLLVCGASGHQWSPAAAFDGTNWLVVWSDQRGTTSDVYAARVDETGRILDPSGIAVSAAAQAQLNPSVTFDGSDFLVVWEDRRSGSADVYAARVSTAGTVLDPAGIAVCTLALDQTWPAIASDGVRTLAAWVDARSGGCTDIWGARLGPDGVVLDTSGIPICTSRNDQWYPAVLSVGSDFLLTWTDIRSGLVTEICGARVSGSGRVTDTFTLVSQEGNQWSGAPAVSPQGRLFLAHGGWAGAVAGKTYNTYRVWGKVDPVPGIAEQPATGDKRPATGGPTILSASAVERLSSGVLYDALGRRAPTPRSGVYFLREEPQASSHKPQAIRKVVVRR